MEITYRVPLLILSVFIGLYLISQLITINLFLVLLNIVLIFVISVYLITYLEMRQKTEKLNLNYPSISIVIPNYNSSSTLKGCIKAVKAMHYPKPFEILVIDDGSTDGSQKILKGIKGIKVLAKKKNEGKARALNEGIRMVKGELVACIDADTFPEKDVLEKMAAMFADEKTGAVTGFIKVHNPKSILQKIQAVEYTVAFGLLQKVLSYLNGVFVTPGPMSIYRRKLLIDLGGYDETNLTEDMEIAFRLQNHGYRIKNCPEATIPTEVPETLGQLIRQRTRWYRGKFVNSFKYKDMIFNPGHGQFGMFCLPFSLIVEGIAMLLILTLILVNLESAINYINYLMVWLAYDTNVWNLVQVTMVTSSALLFQLLTTGLFLITIIISHLFIKEKLTIPKLFYTLIFITIYSLFVAAIYFLSFLKEVNKSEYTW